MNLTDMRRNYADRPFDLADLQASPLVQFDLWMRAAIDSQLLEPNAMALASVDHEGQPSLRTVLLKGFDEHGFVFYTNYESAKARQIAGNPKVALLFQWLPLERQVAVAGKAEKISTTESLRYFLSRPQENQIGAWASRQSEVVSTRSIIEGKFAEMKAKFANRQIPLPSFWGGYRVRPESIEFWQGRSNRLHDRFRYTRESEAKWTISRLMP